MSGYPNVARADKTPMETQNQLTISPALHQAQLDFVKQQLQQLHNDILSVQDMHPYLQAFSLQQHQKKLLSIDSKIYTKFVQFGLIKKFLPNYVQII